MANEALELRPGEIVFVEPGFDGGGNFAVAPKGSRVFFGEVVYVPATQEQIDLISVKDEAAEERYEQATLAVEAARAKVLAGAFASLIAGTKLTPDEAMALGAQPLRETKGA